MAFLDKISQAGQSAVQKTKDMTEIARINSLISDEEKKMNLAYVDIGKKYVSLHRNDSEAEFAAFVKEVVESEEKIAVWRDQILNIRGVRRCPNCGAELKDGVAFCSECGASVPKGAAASAEASKTVCPNCGAELKAGAAFCTKCGTKLN